MRKKYKESTNDVKLENEARSGKEGTKKYRLCQLLKTRNQELREVAVSGNGVVRVLPTPPNQEDSNLFKLVELLGCKIVGKRAKCRGDQLFRMRKCLGASHEKQKGYDRGDDVDDGYDLFIPYVKANVDEIDDREELRYVGPEKIGSILSAAEADNLLKKSGLKKKKVGDNEKEDKKKKDKKDKKGGSKGK